MTTANQKRIEGLEAELKQAKQENEHLQLVNHHHAHYLQWIARDGDALSGEETQEIAQEGLDTSKAEVRMQQRDLNIAYRTVAQLKFPVAIRKMWSGGEVQQWLEQYAEILRQRAIAHGADKLEEKETLQ